VSTLLIAIAALWTMSAAIVLALMLAADRGCRWAVGPMIAVIVASQAGK
jgi:hypothetical protein